MQSIRSRLVAATLAITALVCSAMGLAFYYSVRAELLGEFDRSLVEKAEILATGVEDGPEGIIYDFEDLDTEEFDRDDDPSYFRVDVPAGQPVYRSERLVDERLPWEPDDVHGSGEEEFRTVAVTDGQHLRAVALLIEAVYEEEEIASAEEVVVDPAEEAAEIEEDDEPSDEPRGATCRIVLGRSLAPVDRILGRLRLTALITVAAGALLGVILLRAAVTKSLRPLDEVGARIDELDADHLDRRLAPSRIREIAPVADRINELLDRVQHSFDRERGLTADVAHELRTPVAGLRSTLEVALRKERRSGPEYRETIEESLAIVRAMDSLVAKLLWLFRLEGESFAARPERIDLDSVLHDSWAEISAAAGRKSIRVEWDLGGTAVDSDPVLLRLALQNLLENAVHHGPGGGGGSRGNPHGRRNGNDLHRERRKPRSPGASARAPPAIHPR